MEQHYVMEIIAMALELEVILLIGYENDKKNNDFIAKNKIMQA
jgi:hypothetical protein